MSLDLSNNSNTRRFHSPMFIVDIEEKKKNIHKVNNKKVKEELLLRKTIVIIEFQEQKMNCCDS